MHEPCIDAERDVVEEEPVVHTRGVDPHLPARERSQRAYWVVGVEPEVTGEVVPGSERDDDERDVPLDGDLGHRCQRAVPTGDAERASASARKLGGVVVRA